MADSNQPSNGFWRGSGGLALLMLVLLLPATFGQDPPSDHGDRPEAGGDYVMEPAPPAPPPAPNKSIRRKAKKQKLAGGPSLPPP